MKPFVKIFSATTACAAAALVGGCASAPDRYFTLATPAPTESRVVPANAGAVPAIAAPMFIELAPVAMAERLARPQMLVRKAQASGGASAEVELLEQHRWASSFENEMRDVLASGIAARLGAVDLTKGGRQPAQPAWRIAVQLQNFDAVENRCGLQLDGAPLGRRAQHDLSMERQRAGRQRNRCACAGRPACDGEGGGCDCAACRQFDAGIGTRHDGELRLSGLRLQR